MKKKIALFLLGVGSLVAVSVNASNLNQTQDPVCNPVPCAVTQTVPCDTVCPNQVPCTTDVNCTTTSTPCNVPYNTPCTTPAVVPCNNPAPCDTVCPAPSVTTPVANGCC